MPKPNANQRRVSNGYHENSLLAQVSAEERKRIRALMAKDRSDRAFFERTLERGSQPRRWT